MDTDTFIIYIKTADIYKDIVDDIEKKIWLSNYELNRPLPTEKNTKVIELMKDELKEKIMTEVCCSQTKNLFLLNG